VEDSRDQDSIDTTDVIAPAEASQNANLDFIENSTEKMLLLDKFLFMLNFLKYMLSYVINNTHLSLSINQ
jgi:hypothetical protein